MREGMTASISTHDESPEVVVYFYRDSEFATSEGLLLKPIEARFLILALTRALEMIDAGQLASEVCSFGVGGISVESPA